MSGNNPRFLRAGKPSRVFALRDPFAPFHDCDDKNYKVMDTRLLQSDLNFIQTIDAYCESLVAFAVCCNNFLLSAIMSYLNELVSLCAS